MKIRVQQKRYFERITVTTNIKNKEKAEKTLLKKEFTIISTSLAGRKRFGKNQSKVKIIAEREIVRNDLINQIAA